MKQANLLVWIQLLLFALMVIGIQAFDSLSSNTVGAIGLLIVIVGLGIGLLAMRDYRRGAGDTPNVSPEPKTHVPLVQTGIYGRVRHPIYTGVMCIALGAGLAHGHPVVLLIALAFIPFFTYKSSFEERLLRLQYADYEAYMQHAGRFLPLKF